MSRPKTTIWDPRVDQIRMLKSLGLSMNSIADSLHMSRARVRQLAERFPDPPPIEERMERASTPALKSLTANLHILTLRIRREPIPTWLRPWESPALSGSGRRDEVLQQMRADGATLEQTEFYVTKTLAPGLIDARTARDFRWMKARA